MKAVVVTRPCAAHELMVSEVPTPRARPGWALVKIRAFGINRTEIYTRNGFSPGVRFPRIIGIECVGEVAEIAAADASGSGLAAGQPVVSLMHGLGRQFDGSYAEYALIPVAQVYPVPRPQTLGWPDWDWARLAAVPETWFTAWGSLAALRVQAGDALLIRGGSSACGLAALQLAAHMGAHVTSTTRSPVHAGKIRMLGASIGASMDASIGAGMDGGIAVNIDAKTSAPAPETTLPQPSIQAMIDDGQLARTHPSCFDKALELIGAATLRDTLRCLRPGGVACFYRHPRRLDAGTLRADRGHSQRPLPHQLPQRWRQPRSHRRTVRLHRPSAHLNRCACDLCPARHRRGPRADGKQPRGREDRGGE